MRLQNSRRSIAAAHTYWAALCRPPDPPKKQARTRERAGRVLTTHYWERNYIRLPKTAQRHLQELRARLLDGRAAGTLRAGFVQKCFTDFPELVAI